MTQRDIDLDDVGTLAKIDASGMLGVLERFPDQLRDAVEIGMAHAELPRADCISSVVVLGMGGSGISGAAVAAPSAGQIPVPVITVSGYRLPAMVDENSLVFAVSYSGNTEETLACVDQALERKARVVAVSSGGRLSGLADQKGLPLFKIPNGYQPRAALGYLLVPILATLERLGLVSGMIDAVNSAASMLEERSREYNASVPLDDNPTKRLASDLVGYCPVIYGSEGPLAVAAMRWKTQFNENSKIPAFHNWFPELNHNETVGWQHLEEVCSQCHLIVLREKEEDPRIKKRIDITLDLLRDNVGHIAEIYARGENPLERLLDLVYFGDYTSVYLALALGQDPTPVTRIEELKKRLADDPQ